MAVTGCAAGSGYLRAGGGANYLCLPRQPDILPNEAGPYYGYVEGALYNINPPPATLDDTAPCAVCHRKRSAVFMLPTKLQCYPGW